jgi:XapX domain-containing protein
MWDYIVPLLTGGIVGAVFAVVGANVPAPPNIPGVLGVVGITVGYMITASLRG